MKLKKVISGGQTGADQAGLRAGKAAGLETGGMVPKGCLTDDGPNPDLVVVYGCHESKSDKYPPRTFDNVKNSDATIRLAYNFQSGGEKLTLTAILKYERPWVDVNLAHATDYTARSIAGWLVDHEVGVLNVAGNRERTKPGLGAEAEAFLAKVFHIVKLKESGHECKDTERERDCEADQAGDR